MRVDGKGTDEFRGLYISDEEVDSILKVIRPAFDSEAEGDAEDQGVKVTIEALLQLEADLSDFRDNGLKNPELPRLLQLCELFDLNDFEKDALLICLLPEIDVKYERIFGYIQDDVTKKRPSIGMVIDLLCNSADVRVAARKSFAPEAPLIANRLIRIKEDTLQQPLISRAMKADDRIVDFLLETDHVYSCIVPFVRLANPNTELNDVVLPDEIKLKFLRYIEQLDSDALFYFYGPRGVGRKTTAGALCKGKNLPLLIVDIPHLLSTDTALEQAIELVLREGNLQKAALYFDNIDALLTKDESLFNSISQKICGYSRICFLSSNTNCNMAINQIEKPTIRIDFNIPPHALRKRLWRMYLKEKPFSDGDLDILAGKFRFTGGQIRDAVSGARNLALGRGADADITMADLYQECRAQSNQRLSALARKIQPKFTWEDIVLPKDQMAQLREITDYVKYRHIVFGEWNFEQKVSLGRGLNVLFSGPSGTGKTMAADIMSGELKLDLYKIDLSAVVSKYIGETEKNLDRIFKEAQDSNAILFFDEADAIFGKRSEVRDSHDRYANIEIAYLLQKMEEYDGIVILATNLRKNLDEAFARRMHFSVEFPLPEESDRYRIWQRVFPKEAPLSKDADLQFMARQFKVTGGNIKNIALGAAFLAAADGRVINTEHLIRTTKREYQKIGRLCTEADFGPYFELVKG